MSEFYRIVWPEKRVVSAEVIDGWYSDAVSNGEVEYDDATNADEKAMLLEDAGLISLIRDARP